jgi:hypothetical protein
MSRYTIKSTKEEDDEIRVKLYNLYDMELSADDLIEIRAMWDEGVSIRAVMRQMNRSISTQDDIFHNTLILDHIGCKIKSSAGNGVS